MIKTGKAELFFLPRTEAQNKILRDFLFKSKVVNPANQNILRQPDEPIMMQSNCMKPAPRAGKR